MYYNGTQLQKVEVTCLPILQPLSFRVRPGSKNIILKGIYNHNEDLQNYEMASGDSVTVLYYYKKRTDSVTDIESFILKTDI